MATAATSDLPVLPVKCSDLLPTPGMTRTARLLVTQEARIVVDVDCRCRVQIITPPSKDVFMAIDETPEALGPNRMPYLCAPLPTSNSIYPMEMVAGQFIVLAVEKGQAICGVIITRLLDGGPQ